MLTSIESLGEEGASTNGIQGLLELTVEVVADLDSRTAALIINTAVYKPVDVIAEHKLTVIS